MGQFAQFTRRTCKFHGCKFAGDRLLVDFQCGSDGVGMNIIKFQVHLVQSGAANAGLGFFVRKAVCNLLNGVCLGMDKNGGRTWVLFRFRLYVFGFGHRYWHRCSVGALRSACVRELFGTCLEGKKWFCVSCIAVNWRRYGIFFTVAALCRYFSLGIKIPF